MVLFLLDSIVCISWPACSSRVRYVYGNFLFTEFNLFRPVSELFLFFSRHSQEPIVKLCKQLLNNIEILSFRLINPTRISQYNICGWSSFALYPVEFSRYFSEVNTVAVGDLANRREHIKVLAGTWLLVVWSALVVFLSLYIRLSIVMSSFQLNQIFHFSVSWKPSIYWKRKLKICISFDNIGLY